METNYKKLHPFDHHMTLGYHTIYPFFNKFSELGYKMREYDSSGYIEISW